MTTLSPEEVEKLKRVRNASKGWLSRAASKLEKLVAGEFNEPEMSEALRDFEKRLDAFDLAQSAYEVELKEEAMENEILSAAETRDTAIQAKVKALKVQSSAAGSETQSGKSQAHVRLPKLDLPTFSGDPQKWMSFWDSFKASVDDSELPEISKLTYLKSVLKGEAKVCIEGLTLSKENYDVAIKLLQERYGKKEKIIFSHIQDLLQFNGSKKLQVMLDELLVHVRSLETLGVSGDQYGVILTPLILSRLPETVRDAWARESEGKEADLEWLLSFIKKEIATRERAASFVTSGSSVQPHSRTVPASAKRQLHTASALHSSSPGCGVCGHPSHTTDKCGKLLSLEVHDRHQRIKELGLCFRCLKGNHRAATCKARCKKCEGKHHVVMCFQPDVKRNSASSEKPSSGERPDVSLSCNIGRDRKKPDARGVLPTASVIVKGSKGDVQATLLFDSGSNRSYVSSSLVKKCSP